MSTISTVAINDGVFHNVTFKRTGNRVELLLDNMYISRQVVPGTDELLDIESDMVYLGSDPQLTNGFTGCVYGLRFNGRDMPIEGMNMHFIATYSGGGTVRPCLHTTQRADTPFYRVFENIYILVGVALGLLLILSIIFVTASKSSYYCYTKRRTKFQPQSPRTHVSAISPSINLARYRGIHQDYLQQTNSFEHLAIQDSQPEQINPLPDTSASIEENETPSPKRVAPPKAKRVAHPKAKRVAPPKAKRVASKSISKIELDPMTGMPLHDSDSESSKSITDESVSRYVLDKVKEINRQPAKSYDELHVYNEEGPYQPMGSLESLYDILVEEEEEEQEVQIVKMEVHVQQSSGCEQPPPSPLLSSYSLSPTKSPKKKPHVLNSSPTLSPVILRRIIPSKSRNKPLDKERLLLMSEFTDGPNLRAHHTWTNQPLLKEEKDIKKTTLV